MSSIYQTINTNKMVELTNTKTDNKRLKWILKCQELIGCIWTPTPNNNRLRELISATEHPTSVEMIEDVKFCTVQYGMLYKHNHIEVPNNDMIQDQILNITHNRKFAGHPGQQNTLSLVKHSLTWLPMTSYLHQYSVGWNSFQRFKWVITNWWGTLLPLPIPEGTWKDISYTLIPGSLLSKSYVTAYWQWSIVWQIFFTS